MIELKHFLDRLKQIDWPESKAGQITAARKAVSAINSFLFTTHDGIGTIHILNTDYPYFSEFHKFWNANFAELLNVTIDDDTCGRVADALHDVYLATTGSVFYELYDNFGLDKESVCKVRLLTANQDFGTSLNFSELAAKYKQDPTIFDVDRIYDDPAAFIAAIGITDLSQTDKRNAYARNFAAFVKGHGGNPYMLLDNFSNNANYLKEAMLACVGAGYGDKKADMVLRDMIVKRIWTNVIGFEDLNVASDKNTIRIALRTGILRTSMPLVTSFLDQFSPQYGLLDEMNAKAWRRVWEIWCERFPNEKLASPCLLDYFIYNVIGRQFCKHCCVLKCTNGHVIRRLNARMQRCPVCHEHLHEDSRVLPCDDDKGGEFIALTDFVRSGHAPDGMENCPFKPICDQYLHKSLEPPKSISIKQRTGWETAYTHDGDGGGGLMA